MKYQITRKIARKISLEIRFGAFFLCKITDNLWFTITRGPVRVHLAAPSTERVFTEYKDVSRFFFFAIPLPTVGLYL